MMVTIAAASTIQPGANRYELDRTARHPKRVATTAVPPSRRPRSSSAFDPSELSGRHRGIGAPQEMPPKRRCSSSPWTSSTPFVLMALATEGGTGVPIKIAADGGVIYPDSPLAARMFDSWQYIHDDSEAAWADRCDASLALVLDAADPSPSATGGGVPHVVLESPEARIPRPSSAHSLELTDLLPTVSDSSRSLENMEEDDDLDMSDDSDDDDDTSVLSWDFWPRRSFSRRGEADDDDEEEEEGRPGANIGRNSLLNVDRFMASLVLSSEDDEDWGEDNR